MRSPILFRADADDRIGIGHVMRCLALAEALQFMDCRCEMLARPLPDGLLTRLSRASVTVRALPSAMAGSQSDAEATVAEARALRADRVVVDGYEFGAAYLEALQSAGLRIATIDDHATARVPASDITLNQNIFAPEADPDSGYLSGPRYVLLRRDLIDPHKDVEQPRDRLLVTLGGADPDMVTEKFIQACAIEWLDVAGIDVIVGSANPRARAIAALARPHAPAMRVHIDVPSLAPLLATARLAVIAAGGTMWEALHWGVPMITVHRDRVQHQSTSELQRRGLSVSDSDGRTVSPQALAAHIVRALAEPDRLAVISSAARCAVDGHGAARVAQAIFAM